MYRSGSDFPTARQSSSSESFRLASIDAEIYSFPFPSDGDRRSQRIATFFTVRTGTEPVVTSVCSFRGTTVSVRFLPTFRKVQIGKIPLGPTKDNPNHRSQTGTGTDDHAIHCGSLIQARLPRNQGTAPSLNPKRI